MQKLLALNPIEMNFKIVVDSKRCGGPLKMSGRHAGVAAQGAKTSCLEPNRNEFETSRIVNGVAER